MQSYILDLKNSNGEIHSSILIENIPTESDFRKKAASIYFEGLLDLFIFIKDTQKLNEFKDKNIGLDLHYVRDTSGNKVIAKLLEKRIINIISNLHHACEIYLKSTIVKDNPLKLLNKTTYFNGSKNIDFLNETTLDAHQLIDKNKSIYGASFLNNSYGCDFEKLFNEYRKIRNKNIHSTYSIDDFNSNETKSMFLATFEIFNKNKKLSIELYKNISIEEKLENLLLKSSIGYEIDSLFYVDDKNNGFDYKRKIHIISLITINNCLSQRQASIIFGFNKKSRKAICPNCEKEYRFTIENGRKRIEECPNESGNKNKNRSIKSLVEVNKELNQCFSCGIKIQIHEIIEEYCQCCEIKTIFFIGRGKIKKTCLKCGCINELDFNR